MLFLLKPLSKISEQEHHVGQEAGNRSDHSGLQLAAALRSNVFAHL